MRDTGDSVFVLYKGQKCRRETMVTDLDDDRWFQLQYPGNIIYWRIQNQDTGAVMSLTFTPGPQGKQNVPTRILTARGGTEDYAEEESRPREIWVQRTASSATAIVYFEYIRPIFADEIDDEDREA